jgi:glucoamylase
MEIEQIRKKIIAKILENIYETNNGTIIASPSKSDPNYYYHWIRDSALTMRVIVNLYKKTKELKYLEIILKYINTEYKLIDLDTLSGIGEPKFNVNKTCFNDNWGRPQNDGPALRGIIMIEIARLLEKDYNYIVKNIIHPILIKDMQYTMENIDKPCFDLWEEKYGYHFYTRLVIAKFIKEYNKYILKNYNCINIQKIKEYINHHIGKDRIISSFDNNGKIIRYSDASIFMALNHIDYDQDIFPKKYYTFIDKNILDLIFYFNKKYEHNYNMIGRYEGDNYYNGQSWIICTVGLMSYFKHIDKNIDIINSIIDKIINLDDNFDLAEQYNPVEHKFYSAKKLTWNYTELYFYFNN